MSTKVDVVIVGGGTAGVIAAVAAAREGADVLIIERYGFLGGNLAGGSLEAMMTFHDWKGQIIGGIPQELVDRLVERGGAIGHISDISDYCATITPFDHEILKETILDMVLESGAKLLLHTLAVGTVVEDNRLQGVIVENKSGRNVIIGRVFVDSSGDADVAARAGVYFEQGRSEDGLTQPVSLLFRLNGVEMHRLVDYVSHNPQDFRIENLVQIKNCPVLHLWGFRGALRRALQNGDLSLNRDELHMIGTLHKGEVIVNATRVVGVDGTKSEDLTKAEIVARRQIRELVMFFQKYIPGFEKCYLSSTAVGIGVRETRRIRGEYVIKKEDIVSGARFPDAVARGAFPIDIHEPNGSGMNYHLIQGAYDIPWRSLLPIPVEGLIVAGRCISATHEAMASLRVTATCMAVGQAAGVGAVLAAKKGVVPRQIDYTEIQNILRKQGALLE